jgi:tripartite-type tricarboxylate transporter receptor subunit TctC
MRLFVPVRTPPSIVAKLHELTVAALDQPVVKKRYEELGATVQTSTPSELGALLRTEIAKWTPLIREANIKPE